MGRQVVWSRSRLRTIFQQKGVIKFKTMRSVGLIKGYNELNECVIRINDYYILFNSTYEIEIPIMEIVNIKISNDYPYLNILIFTKKNEMLEFHIPYYDENKNG